MDLNDGVTFDFEASTEVEEVNSIKTCGSKNLDRFSKHILSLGLKHSQGLFSFRAGRQKEAISLQNLLVEGLLVEVPNLNRKFPDLYQLTAKGFNTLKVSGR